MLSTGFDGLRQDNIAILIPTDVRPNIKELASVYISTLFEKERKVFMYSVQSVMSQLTDPGVIMGNVSDTLRKIDPQFTLEEQKYICAVEALKAEIGDTVSPTAAEYIAAKEQKICAELVYVAWLGFQQNLACFQNPVNSLFLKLDYEDFHQERRMHTLPQIRHAMKTIDSFYVAMREFSEKGIDLTDGIVSYMSYLETTGYKLAHYFGFILADKLLEHVIPGYCSDSLTTLAYARELREYLKLDLKALE